MISTVITVSHDNTRVEVRQAHDEGADPPERGQDGQYAADMEGDKPPDHTGRGRKRRDPYHDYRAATWARRRKGTMRLSDIYAGMGDWERARRVASCAEYMLAATCADDDIIRVMGSTYCHDRLCPVCSWRRARRWAAELRAALERAEEQDGGRWMMLTLTARNVWDDELAGMIDAMLMGVRELMSPRLAIKSTDYARSLGRWRLGYVRALEVTRHPWDGGEWAGSWHPHIHLLLHINSYYKSKHYVTRQQWAELWRLALGIDYEPMVHVQWVEGAAGAAAEVAKYVAKSADILDSSRSYREAIGDIRTLSAALRGRRIISAGGSVRRARHELGQRDEPDDADMSDAVDMTQAITCPICGREMDICVCEWEPRWHRYRRRVVAGESGGEEGHDDE